MAACLLSIVGFFVYRSQPIEEVPVSSVPMPTSNIPAPVLTSPSATPELVTPKVSSSASNITHDMLAVFSTPITFYGRVVDQHGNPVPNAKVSTSASTSMGGNSIKMTTAADASGNFVIHTKGMSLFVSVDKLGYFHVFPRQSATLVSEKVFDFGYDTGRGIHKADQGQPVLLQLYKPGKFEPLVKLKSTSRRLSRSGASAEVALDPEQGGWHKISLSCKAEDIATSDGRFTWQFEVRVLAGGLIEDSDPFQFEAPAVGYQQAAIIEMPHSIQRPQWQDSVRRSYFVHFDDDTFARIKVEMIAFGDYFSVIEGYFNPKIGSRNLEADPSKK